MRISTVAVKGLPRRSRPWTRCRPCTGALLIASATVCSRFPASRPVQVRTRKRVPALGRAERVVEVALPVADMDVAIRIPEQRRRLAYRAAPGPESCGRPEISRAYRQIGPSESGPHRSGRCRRSDRPLWCWPSPGRPTKWMLLRCPRTAPAGAAAVDDDAHRQSDCRPLPPRSTTHPRRPVHLASAWIPVRPTTQDSRKCMT